MSNRHSAYYKHFLKITTAVNADLTIINLEKLENQNIAPKNC